MRSHESYADLLGTMRNIKLTISLRRHRLQRLADAAGLPHRAGDARKGDRRADRRAGCTRTPAAGPTPGVHAVGQVVNFYTDTRARAGDAVRAVNAHLPADVVVREAAEVPQSFDANKDAVRKLYRYVIHDGPVPDPFLRQVRWPASSTGSTRRPWPGRRAFLVGRHDFHSFETDWPNRQSSVRTITHLAVNRSASTSGSTWRRTVSCTTWCGRSPGR